MRGELEFEFGLRERMRLLRRMTEAELQRALGRLTLNPGARMLVQTMKAHGAHTVLVSGGFTFFTSAVAERAGFAANRGNVLLRDDGRLAGAAEPIQGREAKLATLNEEAAAHGISPAEVIAVGDGANDLAMRRRLGSASPTGQSPSSPPKRMPKCATATLPRFSISRDTRATVSQLNRRLRPLPIPASRAWREASPHSRRLCHCHRTGQDRCNRSESASRRAHT